jgi:hypothetical protein
MILVHVYRFTSPDSCARLPIYKPWFLCTFTDLQALILVHVYQFTNLDSCARFIDLQESDLQPLIRVHIYRFWKNQIT